MTEQEQELTKEQEAERERWRDLEAHLTDELEAVIANAPDVGEVEFTDSGVYEIQPPRAVVRLAAQAAAAVLLAFKHGYQMTGPDKE